MLSKKVIIIAITVSLTLPFCAGNVLADETSVTPTPIDYDLSYPGLLPDHPFYFLKNARDTMFGFFIGQPLEKAAFSLKQSDKEVAAGEIVIKEKNNISLAKTSLTASQRHFEDAIAHTIAAQKQGMQCTEMIGRLRAASKKHQEVIEEIYYSSSVEEKKLLEEERQDATKLVKASTALKIK